MGYYEVAQSAAIDGRLSDPDDRITEDAKNVASEMAHVVCEGLCEWTSATRLVSCRFCGRCSFLIVWLLVVVVVKMMMVVVMVVVVVQALAIVALYVCVDGDLIAITVLLVELLFVVVTEHELFSHTVTHSHSH